jgi:hypothetical protein
MEQEARSQNPGVIRQVVDWSNRQIVETVEVVKIVEVLTAAYKDRASV